MKDAPLRKWLLWGLGLGAAAASSLVFAEASPVLRGDRLAEARAQLGAAQERAEEVATRLAALDSRIEGLKGRLTADGRALYRLGRNGLLPVTSGLEGLLGHASRMQRLERMVRADLGDVTEAENELRRLRIEKGALAEQIVAQQAKISGLERVQAAAIQQQIEQNLLGMVATKVARDEPVPRGDHMSYGLSLLGGKADASKFADQRGALALPVSGPSSIQEASRAESGGPGLEFIAQRGAAVRAAAFGRVAFSDRYGSYGQLVIVDHGERYYTVYGGFSSVEVQVGDEVSKSARLGTAGAGAIYFEVRRGTKTEEARPWLGL